MNIISLSACNSSPTVSSFSISTSSNPSDASFSHGPYTSGKKRKNYEMNNARNNFLGGGKSNKFSDSLSELAYYTALASNSFSSSVTTALNNVSSTERSVAASAKQNETTHSQITNEILDAKSYSEITRVLNKWLPSIRNSPKSLVIFMKQMASLAEKSLSSKAVGASSNSYVSAAADAKINSSFAHFLSVDDPQRVLAMSSTHFKKNKKEESNTHSIRDSATLNTSENVYSRDETDLLKLVKLLDGCLSHLLKQNTSLFEPDDLVGYMYCLAKCGVKQKENYILIATEVECRPQRFSPKELQEMLWSYTKCLELNSDAYGGINIASYDSEFLAFLAQQFIIKQQKLSELDPQQLSLVVRCLNRLSYKNNTLLQLLGKVLLVKQKQFSHKQWGLCVLAFSRFGVPLRDECVPIKKLKNTRDWQKPPPPRRPKPMSLC